MVTMKFFSLKNEKSYKEPLKPHCFDVEIEYDAEKKVYQLNKADIEFFSNNIMFNFNEHEYCGGIIRSFSVNLPYNVAIQFLKRLNYILVDEQNYLEDECEYFLQRRTLSKEKYKF